MATYVGKSDWMKKVLSKLNVYKIAKSFCNKWCKFSQQSIQIIINKIFNHIIGLQLSRFRYKVQKAKAYTYMSFLLKCHENILNCSTTFLVWLFSIVHTFRWPHSIPFTSNHENHNCQDYWNCRDGKSNIKPNLLLDIGDTRECNGRSNIDKPVEPKSVTIMF